MSKHTPGPWEAHAWGDADWEILSKDQTVADIHGGNDHAAEEADARLIAAAPDLLACLKNLVNRRLIRYDATDALDETLDLIERIEGEDR